MTRTLIDIDDEALEAASRELGTSTKRDTVNEALRYIAGIRRRTEIMNRPGFRLAGEDALDPEIMRQASR
jgi:Arc/MetJ family transcription regulator